MNKSLFLLMFALLVSSGVYAQVPLISSYDQGGMLISTNLEPDSIATVEWAPTVGGPWTNTWAGLESVPVSSNGTIEVAVPMFYRLRGEAVNTNAQGIVLSKTSLFLSEGGETNFSVRLIRRPATNLTVNIASSDISAATVSPGSLTFSTANYATPQTVTVAGVNDLDKVNESVTVICSSAGIPSQSLIVNVIDDD